ncbi:JAB domain-containing protein [Puniceicoccales bacterium CK1056]|uniref:JAB domain-containing protein n=1 Tax=Oceanipulchritudo coccoides TaxID=2706888 RepID=A0A6B2M5B4_9BACT|nr:DNA repair protein RadC [Oceanipulchritudo coccoides]NDV63586.1 JAB domain-containing protein [Oceanipulchritudo coccoides]
MTSLNTIPLGERPQERLQMKGPNALSDAELLAIVLRSGTRGCDVLSLSHKILHGSGSLRGLLRLTVEDMQAYPGIGGVKALQLQAMIEIARRVLSTGEAAPLMDSPERIYNWLRPIADGEPVEKFWVLSLSRKNRLLRCQAVTSGTATASLVHPREVFREAIRNSASALVCAHNHPSGDPSPSQADIRATRQLREASKVVQLDLLDHVIIGQREHDPAGSGYYSFAESGIL